MKTEKISITTEYIKLDQLLKFSGMAENGAQAKEMILEGIVLFNGDVCMIRGKKVRPGEEVTIEFDDEAYKIVVE